jgi:ATP-binding cassette subfamily F protein 1
VAGRRYGLVGPNGKGKSTLLKLIGWRKVPVPAHMDVLMVEQEVVGSNETTALQAVVAADTVLMGLREEEAELKATLARLESGEGASAAGGKAAGAEDEDADDVAAQLGEVYQRLAEHGSGGAEARAAKILAGLGFSDAMQKRVTGSFSGGWRMRISLARALYVQPTLLLLDEVRAAVYLCDAVSARCCCCCLLLPLLHLSPAPVTQPTNHLDLRAVLWLEEYLQRWKKTLVVVSHDREFLNNVCTDIIHLHDLKLTSYRGSFAQFEEMYEQRRREANKAFEKYEKQLKAAKATSSKAKIEKVQAGAKQKAEQQAAKKGGKHGGGGGSDEEGGAKGDAPRKWSDYTVSFAFPEPTELPPPLLSLSDCCFKYPGREDFGLADVSCGLDMGSRVAIVGPNGAGKSTLLNLIAGDLDPSSGESRRSQKLRIGRYSQHFVDILAYDENPVEYLMRMHPTANLKPETARALLGRFGLEGHNHLTPIIKLSGGQKARVVFASICLSQPHMLLLDEVRACACEPA